MFTLNWMRSRSNMPPLKVRWSPACEPELQAWSWRVIYCFMLFSFFFCVCNFRLLDRRFLVSGLNLPRSVDSFSLRVLRYHSNIVDATWENIRNKYDIHCRWGAHLRQLRISVPNIMWKALNQPDNRESCVRCNRGDQVKSRQDCSSHIDCVVQIFAFFPKDIFLGPVWALSVGVYVRCERRESVPR